MSTGFALTCGWVEACEAPSAGMGAHPIHGVIPVCARHAELFGVRLITRDSA